MYIYIPNKHTNDMFYKKQTINIHISYSIFAVFVFRNVCTKFHLPQYVFMKSMAIRLPSKTKPDSHDITCIFFEVTGPGDIVSIST